MTQQGEEAAELLATMKGDHVAMKQWYNSNHSTAHGARAKYGGEYPAFWRDVINWPGWKETRKAYMSFLAMSDKQTGDNAEATGTIDPPKRKRRSRWGASDNDPGTSENPRPGPRRSRWSSDEPSNSSTTPTQQGLNINAALSAAMSLSSAGGPNNPAAAASKGVLDLLPGLPASLTSEQQQRLAHLQHRLRISNEKLNNLEQEASRVDALPRGHRERSPSPPPVYGADGKRKNTRAVRWRERYTNERLECLEQIMELNSAFKVAGFQKRKRSRKIFIPVEQHPTYNFIGLIIGPRGKTQKEMESKTGCKIAIRGKGSIKEGSRGRKDGKLMEGDDEQLHVVITGDEQANVDQAAKLINDMLVVIDDDKNVHKQNQLRELALLNGTLKEEEFCPICAERGHRQFECPKKYGQKKSAGVELKCEICGDTSHPTRDCTQHRSTGVEAALPSKELDSDYMAFMAELDSGKRNGGAAPAALASTTAHTPVPIINLGVPSSSPAATMPVPPQGLPPAGLPPPPPPPPPLPQPPVQNDRNLVGRHPNQMSTHYNHQMANPGHFQAPRGPGYPPASHARSMQEQAIHGGVSLGTVPLQGQMPPSQYQGQMPPSQYQGQMPPPQYQYDNQQGNTTGRRKKSRRGYADAEDETLQGWNPQQYFQQGGGANPAGGFNWWEHNN
jgi:splicing factor 1